MPILVDDSAMETDLAAKIAEVNTWIGEHKFWFHRKIRHYGCAERELMIPRLVASDTTFHAPAFTTLQVDQMIANAVTWEASALAIHHAAITVAKHQYAMFQLYRRNTATSADKETAAADAVANVVFGESAAADAVARTAFQVSAFYGDLQDKFSNYKNYDDTLKVVLEARLAKGQATLAAHAAAEFGEYKLTTSEPADGMKATAAAREAATAETIQAAAISVAERFDAIFEHLMARAFPENLKDRRSTEELQSQSSNR
jgi:hypothetical protein